jgi:hypothetical protein
VEELWLEVGQYKQFLTKLIFMSSIFISLTKQTQRETKHNDMDNNFNTMISVCNTIYEEKHTKNMFESINIKHLQQQQQIPNGHTHFTHTQRVTRTGIISTTP